MQAAHFVFSVFRSKKVVTPIANVMLIALLAVCSLAAQSQKPPAAKTAPKTKSRLATAIDLTLEKGHDGALPPHISTLLGLSHEKEVPIKQAVEMGEPIRGFEVSTGEHNDLVIFVENRTTKETTFYLTSRGGTLRKVLSVREGTGYSRRPTKDDQMRFARKSNTGSSARFKKP